jgi:hypothetical protein
MWNKSISAFLTGVKVQVAIVFAVKHRDKVAAGCPQIRCPHPQGCPALGAARFENNTVFFRDNQAAIWSQVDEQGIRNSHVILLVGGAIQLWKVPGQREE